MGYADRLRSMMRGQITSLAPKFPESGPPTLAVSGLDGMLQLRDRKPGEGETKKYEHMADWEIAQVIAERNGLRADVTQEGEVHDLVVQKNQDDAQFLMERAKRIDFDCFVLTDPDTGEDTLYFVKPPDGREDTRTRVLRLRVGQEPDQLHPEAHALAPGEQGDRARLGSRAPSRRSSTPPRPPTCPAAAGAGPAARRRPRRICGARRTSWSTRPWPTEQEAKELAISLLRERAYEFITGTGQVIGLPDLRPGDNVELHGLGQRFSGQYYVKKVEHTLGSNGYLTTFEVRRVFDGGVQ